MRFVTQAEFWRQSDTESIETMHKNCGKNPLNLLSLLNCYKFKRVFVFNI